LTTGLGTLRSWRRRAWALAYRPPDPDLASTPVSPRSPGGRVGVVALHLAPGVLAYVVLRVAREPLGEALDVGDAEAQAVALTGVMVLMGAGALLLPSLAHGLGVRRALRTVGVTRLDRASLVAAVAVWLAVAAVSAVAGYEDDLRRLIEGVSWLSLPEWHLRRRGLEALPPLLGAVALGTNLLGEELWFRGYLQDRLRFLGPLWWLAAGVLFTLYHVFQAPVTYPAFVAPVSIAALYALRHDLWSCVLLHALLQVTS
jgi:uncharacterized protein